MSRLAIFGFLTLAVCTTAPAQHQTVVRKAPSAAKNAGIYHVATGTWTRTPSSAAAFGPDVVYNNTAGNGGYFASLGLQNDLAQSSVIDEGRLPDTTSSILGVDRDRYEINGAGFTYCTDVAGPNVDVTFRIFESYIACDLPSTTAGPLVLSGSASMMGLPGGGSPTGAINCWTVTIDLQGSEEFCVRGEGGAASPGHQGDENDSFGIEWSFDGLFGTNTGLMLAGDPDWTASVQGAVLHGGTGTYYGLIPSCADTGLDTQDLLAVDGATSLPVGPACYFFGGYKNANGCNFAPSTPFSSLNYVLFADAGSCDLPPTTSTFCEPAGTTASGTPVTLTASSTSVGSGLHLDGSGGPDPATISGFGYFLVSAGNTASIPVNLGRLCLNDTVGRYAPQVGGDFNSLGVFDSNLEFLNVAGTSTTGFGFDVPIQLQSNLGGFITPGSTWHFQLWFRDLALPSGNPTSNFSNGISVTF